MENSELVLKYIDQHNSSAYKIAKNTGISESTISKWRSNPTSKIDVSILQKIAAFFGITVSELLDENQASVIKPDEKLLIENYKMLSDIDKVRVLERAETLKELNPKHLPVAKKVTPVHHKPKTVTPSVMVESEQTPEAEEEDEDKFIYLDFPALPASAGTGVYIDSDYTEPLKVRADELTVEANYALRVSGNSMKPRYCDGDIVLVQTQPCVEPGEIGIYIYNGEAYIKQFGGNRLISINPDYDDIPITDPDSCYCKGKVIGILDPVKYL